MLSSTLYTRQLLALIIFYLLWLIFLLLYFHCLHELRAIGSPTDCHTDFYKIVYSTFLWMRLEIFLMIQLLCQLVKCQSWFVNEDIKDLFILVPRKGVFETALISWNTKFQSKCPILLSCWPFFFSELLINKILVMKVVPHFCIPFLGYIFL